MARLQLPCAALADAQYARSFSMDACNQGVETFFDVHSSFELQCCRHLYDLHLAEIALE